MANARYKKLNDYETNLWTYGSPVLVEKMGLWYDSLLGVNVLRITFRNVSNKKIYGLGISLTLKTSHGEKIKTIDFNYYAMEVATGKLFGSEEDIVVEEQASIFEISVNRADLANGENYSDKVSLDKMPSAIPLSLYVPQNYEAEFTKRAMASFPKIKLLCAPEKRDDYWRCTCSRIWPNDIKKCAYCRASKDDLFGILPQIKKEEKERLEAERLAKEEAAFAAAEHQRKLEEAAAIAAAEREKEEKRLQQERELKAEEEAKAEAERKARYKKMRKVYIISASAVLVFAVAAFWLIPQLQSYHQHRESLKENEEHQISINDNTSSGGIEGPIKFDTENFTPIFVKGEDLSQAGVETLWRLLDGVEMTDDTEEITVSTDEGHAFMDALIGRDNVESTAISGILIKPTQSGGINIKMYNITYYTESDYREQIEKLGIKNADIVVAAPTEASGSTAMLGLLKFSGQTTSQNGEAIGKIKANGHINIRTSNTILAERLDTVEPGTELSVIEVMDNSWYKIIWEDAEEGTAYTCNYHGEYYDFDLYEKLDDFFIIEDENEDDSNLSEDEAGEYRFEINK